MNAKIDTIFVKQVVFFSLIALFLTAGCARKVPPAPVININTYVDESSKWSSAKQHIVQSGETLYGIAWLYGLDYQVLANNNALEEPYALNVGQTLELMNKPVKKIVPSADISKPVANVVKTPVVANNKKTDTMRTHPTTKKSALEQIPKRVKRWQWPAEGTLISTFSTAEAGVRGIEIANKSGTPVVSAADGKVVYSGNALRGYGNLIIIKHTNKFLSAYAHNSKILVKERDFVQAGEQIAIMGDSGTNSIKLRFEIRYNGKSLDPLKYLPKK
mgnify:FL=1